MPTLTPGMTGNVRDRATPKVTLAPEIVMLLAAEDVAPVSMFTGPPVEFKVRFPPPI